MIATAVHFEPTCRRTVDQPGQPVGDRRSVLVTGETVDAISTPAEFGALVQAELEIMMLAGPVIADQDGSWTFLTQLTNAESPAIPADLLALGVRLVSPGTRIALPATADPPGRPPAIWSAVIGAARRVAFRRACCR